MSRLVDESKIINQDIITVVEWLPTGHIINLFSNLAQVHEFKILQVAGDYFHYFTIPHVTVYCSFTAICLHLNNFGLLSSGIFHKQIVAQALVEDM